MRLVFAMLLLPMSLLSAPLAIKGLTIGTPKSSMEEALKGGIPACNNMGDSCTWNAVYYGQRDVRVIADLIDEKVCRIWVLFKSDDSLHLAGGLLEKFGEPKSSQTRTLVNGFGAKFNSLEYVWRQGHQELTFLQHSSHRDIGRIALTDNGCEARFSLREKSESTKAATDM